MADSLTIIVVGEVCNDIFDIGTATRKNPEAASLIFVPSVQQVSPGMAGNVGRCLQLLDPSAQVFCYHNYSQIFKRRFLDSATGQILFRVDTGDILPDDDKADVWKFQQWLKSYNIFPNQIDAVVVSDYNKGFVSENFVSHLTAEGKKNNFPVFLDTKKILGAWSQDVFCTKINKSEFEHLKKYNHSPETDTKNLIVTLGEEGCKLLSQDGGEHHFPTEKREVVNLCGAGDTFLAALTIAHLKKFSLRASIQVANKAAALKVSRQGTAVVRGEEVF